MKKRIVTTLVLVFAAVSVVFGQSSKKPMDTEPNKQLARQMFEAFNKHDWQKMAGCYANPAEFLDPSYGMEYVKKTHQDLVEKYSEMQKMFPDIKDDLVNVYAAGDKVIVEFVSSGSLPGGEKWKLPICTILTVKDGKIIRDATYYDQQQE